jgi:hypothetical protein
MFTKILNRFAKWVLRKEQKPPIVSTLPLVCSICVANATKELLSSEPGYLTNITSTLSKYRLSTEEEFSEHLEGFHHNPIRRRGETPDQAMHRFLYLYPDVVNCPQCREVGAPWALRPKEDEDKSIQLSETKG